MKRKKRLELVLVSAVLSALITGTVVYVFAQVPTATFYLSGGVYPDGSATYTVFAEGVNYFAKNSNGNLVYSGTNASQVLNDVSTALTSGAIFITQGSYSLDSSWVLDSNTAVILEKEATLTLANSADCTLIRNANPLAGDNNIKVSGGRLDGNKAQQTNVTDMFSYGIQFSNVSNALIENVIIENFFVAGVYLADSVNCTVQQNYIIDCGFVDPWYTNQAGDGIVIYSPNATGGFNSRNIIRNNFVSGSWRTNILVNGYATEWAFHTLIEGNVVTESSVGIYVDRAPFTDVSHNIVFNNSQYDIACYGSVRSEIIIIGDSNFSRVSDNTIRFSDSHGIQVYGGVGITIEGNSIENNTQSGIGLDLTEWAIVNSNMISNNGLNGISWYRSLNGTVTSNVIYDNGWGSATSDGFSIAGAAGFNSSNVIVSGNVIYNSPRYGIYEAGTFTNDCMIYVNNCLGNGHANFDIFTNGSGTDKDHNKGRTN